MGRRAAGYPCCIWAQNAFFRRRSPLYKWLRTDINGEARRTTPSIHRGAEAAPGIPCRVDLPGRKPGTCYPATLVTTADHDDRVVPGHSFKYAATLQAAQSCSKPVLIRIETKAGHGAGKPTSKTIEEIADQFAFAWKNLGMMAVP